MAITPFEIEVDADPIKPNGMPFGVISRYFDELRRCQFTPESRHWSAARKCPLSATSGLVRLFDHLVGTIQQRRQHREAERLGGFQIDNEFKFRGLLSRQI